MTGTTDPPSNNNSSRRQRRQEQERIRRTAGKALPLQTVATTSSSESMMTDATDDDDTFACPVDRDWLKRLIVKHSSNPNHGQGLVVAPMVDQSDYPYRLLTRKYGANVTFTPMINAGLLVRSKSYQAKFIPTHQCPTDRPLIAQLCGHDPDKLEQAARLLVPFVDAIDLNCGCPQGIAKRGFYGAFLLEDQETLLKCVRRLTRTISKPVSVKVRLLPGADDSMDVDASLALYTRLVNAGIHLLTIHGRTRHQLQMFTGAADWTVIATVVQELGDRIPIFANGNIGSLQDVQDCFASTNVDGVMSSEAILEYPALFAGDSPRRGRIQLAKEYLQLAKQYPPELHHQGSGIKCLKAHVHRFLHPDLEDEGGNFVLRQQVAQAADWQVLWDIVAEIEAIHAAAAHKVEEETLGWYVRHRRTVTDGQGHEMTALQLKCLKNAGGHCRNNETLDEVPPSLLFDNDDDNEEGDY